MLTVVLKLKEFFSSQPVRYLTVKVVISRKQCKIQKLLQQTT